MVIIMKQKRYHYRAKTILPVVIDDLFYGTILEISAGGVLLRTDFPLRNRLVLLDVRMPNHHLKAFGLVVREVNSNVYGVEFLSLLPREKAMISQFIFRFCVRKEVDF